MKNTKIIALTLSAIIAASAFAATVYAGVTTDGSTQTVSESDSSAAEKCGKGKKEKVAFRQPFLKVVSLLFPAGINL